MKIDMWKIKWGINSFLCRQLHASLSLSLSICNNTWHICSSKRCSYYD